MRWLIVLIVSYAFSNDITTRVIYSTTAYIPSQCYTKTEDKNGNINNPCYACHTKGKVPNFLDDSDLQISYAFPEAALKNPFTNLFVDRSKAVSKISDKEIIEYIKKDNYKDGNNKIYLAEKLKSLPKEWDYDNDGKWDGYIPDCYFNFDNEGFDRDAFGKYTGWRAFAYYPFLGTFWPTNGSTDDVLIRLAPEFRERSDGSFDIEVYKINLAIIEALISRNDIEIEPVDERKYEVDLDKDGKIGIAKKIRFEWAPSEEKFMSYVGKAKELLESGKQKLAVGLYPIGTEFLHSVRYIDATKDGNITLSLRLKELRYMKKEFWLTYSDLRRNNLANIKEKFDFPEAHDMHVGDMERGFKNGSGWVISGFIEDSKGELRPQSNEETLFCIGCHSNLGATTDSTFAFPRKKGYFAGINGWYHWSQKGLKNVPEPKRDDGRYEYSYYLENNRAGDEFRENDEVIKKFFTKDGEIKENELKKLHNDVSYLLFPSYERAMMLNKAYREIVKEQSFIKGRDVNIAPTKNVHKEVTKNMPTGIKEPIN